MNINYFKSALTHHTKGNWNKAREIYEHILKSNPNNYSVLQNYGPLLCQLKEYRLAKNVFEKSIKIKPNDPLLLYNYGKFYHDQNILDKAIRLYQESYKIEPRNNFSLYNIGNIFFSKSDFNKAISSYKKYIEKNPKNSIAYNNLANSLKNNGNFNEAIRFYINSIKINNNNADVHVNYSTLLLMLEKFDEGFKEYEWRKKSKSFLDYINYKKLKLKSKVWGGENLDKKKLLVISEQGIGDLIQFSRYLYEIKKKYKVEIIIYLKSKKFNHFFDNKIFEVICDGDLIPKHEYHIHLLSVLSIFNKSKNLFVNPVNIFHKKNSERKWVEKLKKYNGVKIGINSTTSLLKKNIPLNFFTNLATTFDFTFIVLQKEMDEKYSNIKNFIHFKNIDISENAFSDSIEIIKNLDLVISADTSMAHLSATIGKETWIPLPFVSDWRWFLDQKKSKWYKNVKLYRSKKINNWESSFEIIKEDLKKKFLVK